MLIDTHCHLDAAEFADDLDSVIQRAFNANVASIVIPAVSAKNWLRVKTIAQQYDNIYYALGIHPLFVLQSDKNDLILLRNLVKDSINDPKLVAIGEIGLDFYLPEFSTHQVRSTQEYFYQVQLKIANEFSLPVLLHLRKSQDNLLKYLRRLPKIGGIAHAFNGSLQQAEQFIEQGFALGVGGAMTYQRAKQIHRIITGLGVDNFVLETDAPDMSPSWLKDQFSKPRNEPAEIVKIAERFAELRSIDTGLLIDQCAKNAQRVLPKLLVKT